MVEAAAEASEELMDKYLNDGSLTEEEIHTGLRIRTLANEIVPALCGSAFKNKGVQSMLDGVIRYLPSPLDIPAIKGLNEDEEEVSKEASDEEPFSALAFKIATDPFVGTLTFLEFILVSLLQVRQFQTQQKVKKKELEEYFRCILIQEKKLKK